MHKFWIGGIDYGAGESARQKQIVASIAQPGS